MAQMDTLIHCTSQMTDHQSQRFLENLRNARTAYNEAHGLPVPDFTEVDHYMLPSDYFEWRDGIPRIPAGSDRLTWRSKEGNIVAVTSDGYAHNDYNAAYARLPEILARLAEYEDLFR